MKKKSLLLIILCLIAFTLKAQTIELEEFGSTFFYPTNIKNAGDDRMFISEQAGYIKILMSDGVTIATPFLDIESKVYDGYQSSWEKGFLGFVFHPNYSSNGYFYVHYVNQDKNSVISRFTRNTYNIADASSELVLMTINSNAGNHYGGDLAFGPDGYLYLTKGDGGDSAGDPDNLGQDLTQLEGKMLRIDVNNPDPGENYGIPASNPFANDGDPATRGEIWAYGLRNPAKFSFDSLTGDLWIGDVGQHTWEEIILNVGNVGGLNYGWSCYEADDVFNTFSNCPSFPSTVEAVHQINHNVTNEPFRCSVAAGIRYRGSLYPNFVGVFFAADWCSREIFTLSYNAGSWVRTNHPQSGSIKKWVAFSEDSNGQIYILSNPLGNGRVYKINDPTALNVKEPLNIYEFTLIPNPSDRGSVTLNFYNTVSLKEINTFNLQGQMVKSRKTHLNSRSINLEFNNLSSGMYIIEAISSTGEKSQNKLIIK